MTLCLVTDGISKQRECKNIADNIADAPAKSDNLLKTIRDITRRILAAKSPIEIAKVALEHLYQSIPYAQANVFEYDLIHDEIVVLVSNRDQYPLMLTGDRLPFRYFSLESTLFSEEIIYIPDMCKVENPNVAQKLVENVGLRSYISAPLISHNAPIGALNVASNQVDTFTKEDIEMVREVADILAVSLQQARLYQQVQSYTRELEDRVQERTSALQTTNLQLERAVRLKDEFLANMSHELRTPLNAILAKSDTLLNELFGPLNQRQSRSVQTIQDSGTHLLDLINDILDLSKIEAEQMHLKKSRVSLQNLCHTSLQFIREIAHKKGVRLIQKIDPEPIAFWADERRLKQILVNLFSNAIKFTPPGGAVTLDVRCDPEKKRIHFSVQDTGIGIASDDQERLFQPFVQLDGGLNRQHGGTGLGLSLVQRLTALHKGQISLQSEPGGGSTFTISIPWHTQMEKLEPMNKPEKQSVSQPVSQTMSRADIDQASHRYIPMTHRRRSRQLTDAKQKEARWREPMRKAKNTILFAEDQVCNVDAIRDFLEYYGYRIVVAQTGIEAISLVQSICPDLILMDIQMPALDGLEAIQQIRLMTQFQDIPIIALTALAMPGDQERCLDVGANEYVTKPVFPSELLKRIKKYL